MVAGIAHGAPIGHALVWGAVGSGISVMAEGAQSSMATLDQHQAFCNEKGLGVYPAHMGDIPKHDVSFNRSDTDYLESSNHEPEKAVPKIQQWISHAPTVSQSTAELHQMLHESVPAR